LTSAVTLPWVLKFLAGPIIDATTAANGGLRRWIIGCQFLMGISLLPLISFDWITEPGWLTGLLVLHAVMAATQDVAVDTLAIRAVPVDELGRINGWMQAGMLLGRAGVAGGALLLYGSLGSAGLIGALLALIWLPMLVLLVGAREPTVRSEPLPDPSGSWLRALLPLPVVVGLWVALSGGAGFEFLGVAAGPLLINVGANDTEVAVLFAVIAPAGLALGALAGGRWADRVGAARVASFALPAVAAMAVGIALLANGGTAGGTVWLASLACVYAGIGVLTSASYSLFMQLARGRFAATRFSAFMAATNACEAWAGFSGGRMQGLLGYGSALSIMAGLSLLAMPALAWLQRQGFSQDGKARDGATPEHS
jgi:MFS transporter (putative signal transducer)